jgi:hypothetical protein
MHEHRDARSVPPVNARRVDPYEQTPGAYAAQVRRHGTRRCCRADPRGRPPVGAGSRWAPRGSRSPKAPGATGSLRGAHCSGERQYRRTDQAQGVARPHRRTAEEARRRIERDLYNDAQQRLVAVSLSLPLAATQAELPIATALRGVRLPQRLALGASGSGELGFSPQGGGESPSRDEPLEQLKEHRSRGRARPCGTFRI